ncbi:Phenylalanine racemase (ATP-hydrolyzing) [Actinobacteria bacterium OK074]|nr:Phenylalanine racemase (ATP-hydrolyzing) [Actinobacteria bacterium OK074]
MTTAPVHTVDTGHQPFPEPGRAHTLAHRFLAVAAAHPDREAVVTPAVRWTYRDTERSSARVAAGLTAAGLRPGDRVALLFSHGADMIAALLGVLRAGMSYVPLDAAYPEERLAFMAADSGARAVVTGREHLPLAARLDTGQPVLAHDELASGTPDAPVATRAVPDGEAYVLYTSGSTGRPKPVAQVHRNVLHHTRAWTDGLGIGPGDRLSLQSAYSWDSAVQDTFSALLTGAALYPVDLKSLGITGLLEWMAEERVTVYHSTLPVFRALVRAMRARGTELPAMRMLALGGDTLHLADLDAYRAAFGPHCQVAGAYGSTECSCALLRVAGRAYRPPTGVFPLGSPVVGTAVRLEDPDDGRTVEGPGEGEIVVDSPYLAPGAVAGGTVYRTGDLARRLDDGTLLLVGRRDFQVKISGIRVETGEVESVLKDLPAVREAVVMPFTDPLGERQLAAYVVAAHSVAPQSRELRAALRLRLPDHAVPTAYVLLDELPLTANYKIDRAALPDPTATASAPDPGVRGGGRVERVLAGVWCEVLGVADVGLDDNFFDLGGTSLRMAAVHERLTREVAPELRMTDLYRAPTVRALAALVAALASSPSSVSGARADEEVAAGASRGARRRTVRGARRASARARTTNREIAPSADGDRSTAPGGELHD